MRRACPKTEPESPFMKELRALRPERQVSVRKLFGIDSDLKVPAFRERDEHVPEIDPVYRFNPDVTLALLAGLGLRGLGLRVGLAALVVGLARVVRARARAAGQAQPEQQRRQARSDCGLAERRKARCRDSAAARYAIDDPC